VTNLFLLIGMAFAPLGAAMAFVITYEEWTHHHVSQREMLVRSLHMAIVTLVFFLVLSVALGAIVSAMLPH
jgi:hypothetical protein